MFIYGGNVSVSVPPCTAQQESSSQSCLLVRFLQDSASQQARIHPGLRKTQQCSISAFSAPSLCTNCCCVMHDTYFSCFSSRTRGKLPQSQRSSPIHWGAVSQSPSGHLRQARRKRSGRPPSVWLCLCACQGSCLNLLRIDVILGGAGVYVRHIAPFTESA